MTIITQTSIKMLPIPLIPLTIQQKIDDQLKESFDLKEKSHQLLEIAKEGVEKAIETEEETGMKWMREK